MPGSSLSHRLAAELPALRRYARALTGSQVQGDQFVRATLETLLHESAAAQSDEIYHQAPRVALYRLFHRVWSRLNAPEPPSGLVPTGWAETGAQRRLRGLVPTDRLALLLVAMEGFSAADAADILDLAEATVLRHLASAQSTLTQAMRTRVLIIEDEPIIALDLKGIVEEMGHDVSALAGTLDEAVAAARQQAPGLILADIQLADGSTGIDAVNRVLRIYPVPVIFITAYPERLLTGQRPEPTFLIAKPFLEEAVKATVAQALFFQPSAVPAA
jgi:CheY-like chemotaxis protein